MFTIFAEYFSTKTQAMKPLTFSRGAILIALIIGASQLKSNAQTGSDIVINQIYGGGGNSGATFTHDFIELFNNSSEPKDISGWSVQYASAAGSSWTYIPIRSGLIMPGTYFLIQLSSSGENGSPTPEADLEGSINMSSTSGKVILCSDSLERIGTNPDDEGIIDKVGYGSSSSSFETNPAPSASNTKSIQRLTDGVDTNDNAVDFIAETPNPRSSTSAVLTENLIRKEKSTKVIHKSTSGEITIQSEGNVKDVTLISMDGKIEKFTSNQFSTNQKGMLTLIIQTETDLIFEKIIKE